MPNCSLNRTSAADNVGERREGSRSSELDGGADSIACRQSDECTPGPITGRARLPGFFADLSQKDPPWGVGFICLAPAFRRSPAYP